VRNLPLASDGSWPAPDLRWCSLKLTLVGEAGESKVSFLVRP
jgi:hypothetical protein